MRKILFILLLAPFALKSQTVNTFRDSTWFKRGVRFDSTLVFSKGAGVGKVWTSNANGTGSWQTFSSAGVTQGALDDSISAVRAIRKVDTIYKSLDSIVFKINDIRYSVLDSTGGGVQTLSISGDTLSISGGNSVVLPVYVQVDSATVTSYDVLNSQNAPPLSPNVGDVYLVGNTPSGAWVGHAKDIAEWNGSAWVFTDGVQGNFLYNSTTALTYIFRSGNWVQTTGIPALNNGNTISSGLKIGTNNARSLTFETNNVNRGRFDSIGRFYIYDTSLRKSNKYLQIDSITGRLIASEVSGNTSSSLFPNGIEFVSESRDFNSGDANKLLAIKSDDITLSMPSVNPFGKGDLVGIQNINDYKNTHIILKEGNDPILIGDEVFIIDLIDIGGGIYIPQPLTGIIYDENGENAKSITRYLYDQSQNAIPLSGTASGSPVTGDIEIEFDADRSITAHNSDYSYASTISYSAGSLGLGAAYPGSYASINLNSLGDGNVLINSSNVGIRGASDFTPYIDSLDYTQKKYVDSRISDTATQIRSEMPDVSNLATITNLADTSTALRSLISSKVSTTTLTDSLSTKTNKLISFNTYTTSDTLRLSDADKVIEMNVGTANNLVIPTNTEYAFPIGTQITVIQIGAGQTTLVPASGVTVRSASSKVKLSGQYSGATLIKKATNEWYLFGDITN